MHVRIQQLDPTLPLPRYETAGAAGFDLIAREDRTIMPGQIDLVPGNVIVETPAGYALLIVARSSTAKKKGLSLPHGIGIIDADYCGPTDEIWIQVRNFTELPVTVARGEKIAQGLFVPVVQASWDVVAEIGRPDRGGLGSTGGYADPQNVERV